MCSVTCTSYTVAQQPSLTSKKAYNNPAFVETNDEKKLDIEDSSETPNSKEVLELENIDTEDKTDEDYNKDEKEAATYRMHYKVGDVPAVHLSFLFGLQVSVMLTLYFFLVLQNDSNTSGVEN